MTEHVNTDVESASGQPDIEVQANTTGSMKVIITKQEEGGGSEIIDESEMEMGREKKKAPVLNEPSEKTGNTGDLNVGSVLNVDSTVDLAAGQLGVSHSAQKVQLPNIKSLNPLTIPGAFSSSNIKKTKWTKEHNTLSQPISAKHLISQRSKPFNAAIVEEVTKEHFFTKGDQMMNRRSSADQTETSFGSNQPK